jgi:hypothetical protein
MITVVKSLISCKLSLYQGYHNLQERFPRHLPCVKADFMHAISDLQVQHLDNTLVLAPAAQPVKLTTDDYCHLTMPACCT